MLSIVTTLVLAKLIATIQEPPLYRIEPFTLANVKAFGERGADIRTPDGPGWKWIYRAAYDGNSEILRYLLEAGVPATADLGGGTTALYTVAYMSHLPKRDNIGSASVLVANGADVNAFNPWSGDTPLLALARCGDPRLAAYLISKGAQSNTLNKLGESPLFRTIDAWNSPWSVHNYEMVRVLLEGGASPVQTLDVQYPVHSRGVMPIHVAAYMGLDKVMELMVKDTNILNVQKPDGQTPLHVAALRDSNVRVARVLMRAGASRDITDSDGETPVDIAMRKHNTKVLTVLRQH